MLDAGLVVSSFGLVLLAEMGDRSQLMTIMLMGRYGKLNAVLSGAVIAHLFATSTAVAAGTLLSHLFTTGLVARAAGLVFLVFGVWTLLKKDSGGIKKDVRSSHAAWAAFSLVSLVEVGDRTWFAALALAAGSNSPWSVFSGVSVALTVTSIFAVFAARVISEKIPLKWISRGSGVAFILFGLFYVLGA